jgi:AraC-like DNA-binding protein
MSNADTTSPPPTPLWELSTDTFLPADRLDAWHAALSPFNDIWVIPQNRPNFHAATSYWSLGQLVLSNNVASELQLTRSAAQAARDQLDHDVVVVFMAGESRTVSRNKRYNLAGGDMAFGSLRDCYDFRVTSAENARWCELLCPPDLRDRLAELGTGTDGFVATQSPQSRILGQFIQSVADELSRMTLSDLPMIEQAMLCLMAAAGRDATGAPARLSDSTRQTVDRARAVAMIDRELFSARLSADRVCSGTGISRSSLYRLFEADNGVASYIRMRRLDALRSDLVDPRNKHQTVVQLSEKRGFHSPSTLNRAFRRKFGCTPQEIRTLPAPALFSNGAARIDGVIRYLRERSPT